MKTNRLLITIIMVLFTSGLYAQSTTSPDTVCAGKKGSYYYVTKTAGSVYHWVIPNGVIMTGNNTDSITVDWSTTPGTDTIKVVEENVHGCFGDTQRLAVYRMPLPTATVTGLDSLCWSNTGTSFTVTFTGTGPWNFTYSDGTDSTTLTNITTNPYTVNLGPQTSTKTYTITSVSGRFGCAGTTSGSYTVVIGSKPSTSGIYHK
jgi:hypothetical protein